MNTISPTLAINEEISRRTAAGLDTVPLGFGEANVPVHPELVGRLADAVAQNHYGPVAGSDALRASAAGYWARRSLPTDADQVVAGPGSKPLLYALFQVLGGPVALPKPSWVSYAAQAVMLGVDACLVRTQIGEGGVPDPERVDALARERSAGGEPLRVVLVTLPDNPTGTFASAGTVRELCDVARRHDLTIVTDEIYRDLVHDPGAAAWAYEEPDELVAHIDRSRRLHGAIAREVAEVFRRNGALVPAPAGGFYVYPSFDELRTPLRERRSIATSDDLAATLLEGFGIATLPGTAFGDDADHLTLRVATSMLNGSDDAERTRALESDDPAALPWVVRRLDRLDEALGELVAGSGA